MPTAWTLPTTVIQFNDNNAGLDTAWNDANNFEEMINPVFGALQSKSFLFHSARSPKLDVRNKTYFLQLTGFNFQGLPLSLSGIALRLRTKRYGRVSDDTISLCKTNAAIGENRSDRVVDPEKIYGGATDLWGTNLSINDIVDPMFGILLRFQAHPDYPHKDSMQIDSVELQIY